MKNFIRIIMLTVLFSCTIGYSEIFYLLNIDGTARAGDWVSINPSSKKKNSIIIRIHNRDKDQDYVSLASSTNSSFYYDPIIKTEIRIIHEGTTVSLTRGDNIYFFYNNETANNITSENSELDFNRQMRKFNSDMNSLAYSMAYGGNYTSPTIPSVSNISEAKRFVIKDELRGVHYKEDSPVNKPATSSSYSHTPPTYPATSSSYSHTPPTYPSNVPLSFGRSREDISRDIRRTQELLEGCISRQNSSSSPINASGYNSIISNHQKRLYELNVELSRATR